MAGPHHRSRLFIPQLGALYDKLAPFGYPLMRFATGMILLPHGVQKLLYGDPARQAAGIARRGLLFPELLSYLVVFTESFGALMLAIGLFTRLAATMIGIQMLVIVFVFHWSNGYFWTQRGYEYPLLWALLCLGILFKGGGRYSVDRLIGREI